MTINELQDEIIDEFAEIDDWMDRYACIIDMGNQLDEMPQEFKTPEFLIEGCQSRAWLHAELSDDGRIIYRADSDALIVKGIISMLLKVLSGHTPQEIINADLYFINKIGLAENLSPTRSNGLAALLKQMRLYAVAYNARDNSAK